MFMVNNIYVSKTNLKRLLFYISHIGSNDLLLPFKFFFSNILFWSVYSGLQNEVISILPVCLELVLSIWNFRIDQLFWYPDMVSNLIYLWESGWTNYSDILQVHCIIKNPNWKKLTGLFFLKSYILSTFWAFKETVSRMENFRKRAKSFRFLNKKLKNHAFSKFSAIDFE